jgi:hypothetical protein
MPGKITKLKPSRPLKLPDGLGSTGGLTFVMAEGGGSADRLTVDGDQVEVETIKDGIAGPTSVAVAGRNTLDYGGSASSPLRGVEERTATPSKREASLSHVRSWHLADALAPMNVCFRE